MGGLGGVGGRRYWRSPELCVLMANSFRTSQALEHSILLSLTNEKARFELIILALLSYRPTQYIYIKLNIKIYLFLILAHKPSFPLFIMSDTSKERELEVQEGLHLYVRIIVCSLKEYKNLICTPF